MMIKAMKKSPSGLNKSGITAHQGAYLYFDNTGSILNFKGGKL